MTACHAVVWIDGSEAQVLMFDCEHVESQRIMAADFTAFDLRQVFAWPMLVDGGRYAMLIA